MEASVSAGKAITFNSSAKDIIQKLKKAKAQNALPLKTALRKVLEKDGIGYYWILEQNRVKAGGILDSELRMTLHRRAKPKDKSTD